MTAEHDRINELEAEVKRLESIILEECEVPQIAAAFQTPLADGVPLMPGMTVWARFEWESGVISDRSFIAEHIERIDGLTELWGACGVHFKPCDCFATLSALVEAYDCG